MVCIIGRAPDNAAILVGQPRGLITMRIVRWKRTRFVAMVHPFRHQLRATPKEAVHV